MDLGSRCDNSVFIKVFWFGVWGSQALCIISVLVSTTWFLGREYFSISWMSYEPSYLKKIVPGAPNRAPSSSRPLSPFLFLIIKPSSGYMIYKLKCPDTPYKDKQSADVYTAFERGRCCYPYLNRRKPCQ